MKALGNSVIVRLARKEVKKQGGIYLLGKEDMPFKRAEIIELGSSANKDLKVGDWVGLRIDNKSVEACSFRSKRLEDEENTVLTWLCIYDGDIVMVFDESDEEWLKESQIEAEKYAEEFSSEIVKPGKKKIITR